MSLSASIVCHRFCMYKGKSLIGMFSLESSFLCSVEIRYFFRTSTLLANYYFSSTLEGKKKAFNVNKS